MTIMKVKNIYRGKRKGMTLLELIAALVLTGIMSAMLVTLMMSSGLVDSHEPIIYARDEGDVESIMEHIVADYVTDMNSNPIVDIDDANGLIQKIQSDVYAGYPNEIIIQNPPSDPSFVGDSGTNIIVIIKKDGHSLTALFSSARTSNEEPIVFH